ncbi:MAG TPA: CHAD domain-containing protein [Terricaulis sp.]|nr:CHAD domain-containing protein [Terricaulis sp.]
MRPPGPAFDVRAALSAEIAAARSALAAPLDAGAVHAGRVRLKRARAIARLGRGGAPGLADVFDESARAAMRLLAPAREQAALAALAQSAAKRAPPKAAAALNAAAERFSLSAREIDCAGLATLSAALKDLHALAQVWPEASSRQVSRSSKAIVRRARRARKRGLASDDGHARHKWRRREKERLFAAEALGAAWPSARRRRCAARLAEALGKERDLTILIERLRAAPPVANDPPTPRKALKTLRKLAKMWRRRADARGRKLAASRA